LPARPNARLTPKPRGDGNRRVEKLDAVGRDMLRGFKGKAWDTDYFTVIVSFQEKGRKPREQSRPDARAGCNT
jgi:hypothetical protein